MQEIERINKLKPYFKQLNVEGENVYIWVIFPKNWALPSNEELNNDYGVGITPNGESDGGGLLFYTSFESGFSPVFDAVEYVIEYNKTLEEKNKLLIEMANKLRDLFVEEPLERLRTLQFVFKEGTPIEDKKDATSIIKNLPKITKSKTKKNDKKESVKEMQPVAKEEKKDEVVSKTVEEKLAPKQMINSNPLVDFANNLVENN